MSSRGIGGPSHASRVGGEFRQLRCLVCNTPIASGILCPEHARKAEGISFDLNALVKRISDHRASNIPLLTIGLDDLESIIRWALNVQVDVAGVKKLRDKLEMIREVLDE